MNTIMSQMLSRYQINTLYDKKNAVKEIMQEMALCGLSRAGFFNDAVFYGGTALRIFYGLDRFSEDLDFSLRENNPSFNLNTFFPTLEKEILAFGLQVEISEKEKSAESQIQSAFLKGNTRQHLLLFFDDQEIQDIHAGEKIRIKFEVDINPPPFATFEHRFRLLPSPYEVALYDLPSLFAGKIHALLYRSWKSRIKGRDLYDYVFYLSRNTSVNLHHLKARMVQTGNYEEDKALTLDILKRLLIQHFATIDYEQARQDVEPFIRDSQALSMWRADFFQQITTGLTGVKGEL